MAGKRLPLLRGTAATRPYQSVVGGGNSSPVPPRDPLQHRAWLVGQLDAVLEEVRSRPADARDPDATREIIAVRPLDAKNELLPERLADRAGDVRVVGVVPDTGTLLLDAPGPELTKLRSKAEEFGELKTRKRRDGSATTIHAHERALAPVEEIDLARFRDFEGLRLRLALAGGENAINAEDKLWFEIACRGGYRNAGHETETSRAQINRQLQRLDHAAAQEFVAPEEVTFFVRLSLSELRVLVDSVDCVFGYDLAPPEILNWLLLEDPPKKAIRSFQLTPPHSDAPAVVVLDTGIATDHPLLKPAILQASSVVPGIPSPADAEGHGTKMAGVAIYAGDLGRALVHGTFTATHWVQSVRLLVRPHQGSAAEANRPYWPKLTTNAVADAERVDPFKRPRAFVLAITYPINPLTPTTYSQAVDQLAFHDGRGRLLCMSAGNVAPADLFDVVSTYPEGLVLRKIHEPSHGSNVLTVGAYTEKTQLPPHSDFSEFEAVAPKGGLSPHTTTGHAEAPWPIKPEIVLEGGNVARGSAFADAGVESLVTLTTGHDLLIAPLAQICATSEASARAAHMAAAIMLENPTLRPETIRGLLVHSASWTNAMRKQFLMPDLLYTCGYGVPDVEWARACTADRATVIVEDEMPNAVEEERPKKKPPKKPTTPTVEEVDARRMKLFRMPMPESVLLARPDSLVELRVTLSYLPEPSTFRTRVEFGLKLKWDMQGPYESEAEFIERIDDLHRPRDANNKRIKKAYKESFDWMVGITRRSRGTVQSDRWTGDSSLLAGSKLLAVVPILGWWDRRAEMKKRSQPFSLIVSVFADGIYNAVQTALTVPLPIEV